MKRIELFKSLVKFANAMFRKLVAKGRAGYRGFDDPNYTSNVTLTKNLRKNIKDRDWVDVANLALILQYRQDRGYVSCKRKY